MYTSKITPFPHHLHLAIATPHGDELEDVKSAIDTNWITCAGENVTAVEQAIPAYLAEHASVSAPVNAVALGTGTSALHLCMKLAGVKPGDIVLCSSMTFAATVNPVSYEGGIQVFICAERFDLVQHLLDAGLVVDRAHKRRADGDDDQRRFGRVDAVS